LVKGSLRKAVSMGNSILGRLVLGTFLKKETLLVKINK
jgi:hypothetical protein